VPWALPTGNKTFTYFITAVESEPIDDPNYFKRCVVERPVIHHLSFVMLILVI